VRNSLERGETSNRICLVRNPETADNQTDSLPQTSSDHELMRKLLPRARYVALFGIAILVVSICEGISPGFWERHRIAIWISGIAVIFGASLCWAGLFIALGKAGRRAFERGDFVVAERRYRILVKMAEYLRPGNTLLPIYLNNLAAVYHFRARYQEAEAFHKRADDCWKQRRSPKPLEEARNLANLANVYGKQARYSEAEALCREGLSLVTDTAPDDPLVAVLQGNLAEIYSLQGRYAEADLLLQQVGAFTEKNLDKEQLIAAALLIEMAECRVRQERPAEALSLARQSLLIREKILGPDHYEMAMCHYTLAEVYRLQGQSAEAASSCRQAQAIWERSHGTHHPTLANAFHRLALICSAQHSYAEANLYCERALRIREYFLGADHPDTLRSLDTYEEIAEHLR
jgi:tetratricopeptide (TPR) repeat protein